MLISGKRLFRQGELIFREGDRQDMAFIIEYGQVEIFTETNGKKRVLNLLGPGALFGELALIDRQPRSASAMALHDTLCTVVSQYQIDERIADADPILRMMLYVVMRHFRSELEHTRQPGSVQNYRQTVAEAQAFSQKKIAEAIELIKLESELKQALSNNEFQLLYQPIVDITSRKILAVEALIRWQSVTRGYLSPAVFIPLAESTSLIIPIGQWVMEQGLHDLQRFQRITGYELSISFNLARRQIEQPDFTQQLTSLASRYDIQPSAIKLELLERDLFQSEVVNSWIQSCLEKGFPVVLDDFGTGYSSLQYLQEYKPAALKIDRSFVIGLGEKPESERICRAIIDLANALDIGVIAEGIETQRQADLLLQMGCREAQGYLFSRPVPAAELEALIRNS